MVGIDGANELREGSMPLGDRCGRAGVRVGDCGATPGIIGELPTKDEGVVDEARDDLLCVVLEEVNDVVTRVELIMELVGAECTNVCIHTA